MSVHTEPTSEALPAVKDPVCGMDVDPASSKHRSEHDGQSYHFCSDYCRTSFETDPASYLSPRGGRPA